MLCHMSQSVNENNYKMSYFDRRIDSCQNYIVSFKNIIHFNKAKKKMIIINPND